MKQTPWREVTLGECVDLLTGFPFKSSQYTADATDVRLLRGDNVGQGALRWDSAKRWPVEDARSYGRYALEAGDVILAMDRPWIDAGLKWAWVRQDDLPSLLVQRVARMRGADGVDASYLRYAIAAPAFTSYVKSITTGANVPHISGPDIKKYKFQLPALPVQRRIADILSTYDDLIENNTKRITILEDMARSLYLEWFVNFRFPGHEKVKMVSSRLGRVPEEWPIDRLESLLVLQRGFDLPIAERRPGHVPVYAATGCVGTHNLAKVRGPGVLTGRSGSLGSVLLVFEDFWPLNTALWVKELRGIGPQYAYFLLSNLDLRGLDGGAAVPTLNRNHVHALPVLTPPPRTLLAFEELVAPMLLAADRLRKVNRCSAAQRDLLLPRLVSGEVAFGVEG